MQAVCDKPSIDSQSTVETFKQRSGRSAGELREGWRSYPVNLLDMSWNSITIEMALSTAKSLRLNSQVALLYNGNCWHARIVEKATRQGSRAVLTMELQNYEEQGWLRRKQVARSTTPVYGNHSLNCDPVVLALLVVVFLSTLLVVLNQGSETGSGAFAHAIHGYISAFQSKVANYF